MEKYLGNKSSLLPLIDAFLQSRAPKAKSLSDPFAGTTNVSRYFRTRGWNTAACDANRFSYVLAHSYLGTDHAPSFLGVRKTSFDKARLPILRREFERSVAKVGSLYLPDQEPVEALQSLESLSRVLASLQSIGELNRKPGAITNYFSQWGKRSGYASLRGTVGNRNYFSKANSLFLDGVLQTIREWFVNDLISPSETFMLLTSVLEEVVITANVNGTFHDFNRDRIWPNAEQSFFLRVPLISCTDTKTEIINADATSATAAFGRYDVCYLDPPYNFRQYSAYYHFLNFIAAYPFLPNVEAYLDEITHVRGQNPKDDFASDFCYRDKFVGALRRLIDNADCEHVVLSYYGGRNHWNHWSRVDTPTDEGLRIISSVFEDQTLFSSSEIVPTLDIRKNYQSRGGEQKALVNEYLFHGVRRVRRRRSPPDSALSLQANDRFGLSNIFRPVVIGPAEPRRLLAVG
ncbi:DNA adenine methylase [Xylophilus sp. GOD-11R]|uniref:DNA adenine methylase n=1 Tax=Xylophilus sp. GOD-11R TaxID=3089814 RepID=UPI00298CC7C2|nr:DNA adenine methylase [Xylophilus sp. GOD-11R]WPB57364.1 DNA adenine methylase [Xylophilus sp. GOD-11R]